MTLNRVLEKLVSGLPYIDVKNYGVKGDGTDETTLIQAALTAGSGGVVVFPPGNYNSNTLNILDNTTIYGYGAKIYNTTTNQKLLSVGNGVKIYGIELQGKGNSTYNDSGRAIEILGSYNSGVITYKSNVFLKDCYIHDISGYGVYGEYAKNIKIDSCRIENIGYAGVMGISCENFHVVNRTRIKGITPGTVNYSGTTICYGVIFTRKADTNSLTQYPRSKDCSVVNCTVEDNTLWEALDTHAGENISFSNNTVKNCKFGIVATPSQLSGVDDYAPQYCKIIDNTVYGISLGTGIVVAGALNGDNANPTEYADNCTVTGNILVNCGVADDQYGGAIIVKGTRSAIIKGNALRNSYVFGINMYHSNKGFSIVGNTIFDVRSVTYTAPSGIVIRADYNYGVIDGNNTLKDGTGLTETYISNRGIYINLTTNVDVEIGQNYSTYTIPVRNSTHSFAADTKRYFGTAAPTAGVYSIGDITWNTSPTAGGKVGWICVTAGTPGTWKPFGAIDA